MNKMVCISLGQFYLVTTRLIRTQFISKLIPIELQTVTNNRVFITLEVLYSRDCLDCIIFSNFTTNVRKLPNERAP